LRSCQLIFTSFVVDFDVIFDFVFIHLFHQVR
jgi:hypothetical protein